MCALGQAMPKTIEFMPPSNDRARVTSKPLLIARLIFTRVRINNQTAVKGPFGASETHLHAQVLIFRQSAHDLFQLLISNAFDFPAIRSDGPENQRIDVGLAGHDYV